MASGGTEGCSKIGGAIVYGGATIGNMACWEGRLVDGTIDGLSQQCDGNSWNKMTNEALIPCGEERRR